MDKQKDIILIGAGGHATSCINVVESIDGYRIYGLVGRPEEVGTSILGYEVVGSDDEIHSIAAKARLAHIAVGQVKTAETRKKLYRLVSGSGFDLPALVSPFACVSPHAAIGAGSIVMPGVVINSGVTIGENCIINTSSVIEHGVNVEDHCHVSTGAILNGDVAIGEGSFVGSGSVIREGVRIGRRCVIGMGLSIRSNVGDNTLQREN